ncbi:protein of unknown function DUF630 [Dillenia turbinata]|uniref:Uncharacterized protein n=1 Tax=Dillenia turbinata TaxID=194707 RepID=A0AAN8UNR0_9MAGN
MGCAASKLDNEDTVRRCKERRCLMKEVVYARHHFASAHADYRRSLRLTGVALSDFAAGEPLSVSDQTPPSSSALSPLSPPFLLLHRNLLSLRRQHRRPSGHRLLLRRIFRRRRLRLRARKYLTFSPPSEDSTSFSHFERIESLRRLRNRTITSITLQILLRKLIRRTRILRRRLRRRGIGRIFILHRLQVQISSTRNEAIRIGFTRRSTIEEAISNTTMKMKKKKMKKKVRKEKAHTVASGEITTVQRVLILEGEVDRETRSEIDAKSSFKSTVKNEEEEEEGEEDFSNKSDDAGSSIGGTTEISDLKLVVRHKDLAGDCFRHQRVLRQAAKAGEQVSEMLETGRAQLDRSFRKLKKTVYHSSSVLSNLSSLTSKPPLAVKYRLDAAALEEPGGPKSLAPLWRRFLASEKKLYEEVKAREGVKIEHEKKLSTLQSQEYHKTMKPIPDYCYILRRRHHDILVHQLTLETVILSPSLLDCVMVKVRGLVNRAAKGDLTSDMHRQVTRDLESAVSAWHSSFCRLIKYQRDFIRSLHGWLKLTLHLSTMK